MKNSSTASIPSTPSSEMVAALEATAAQRGAFGHRLHYFDEVESTNDLAMRAAERGEPEGSTFVAGAQTAGRGRLGRTWFSPAGAGLYVSVVIRRAVLAPWITLAGGVAVAEGVRAATGLAVQIKWPNDIVVADGPGLRSRRKLAGILAEAATHGDRVQHIVLGYGINLRSRAFPPDLADRATSLATELGKPIDAGRVLADTLVALNDTVETIINSGPAALLERWLMLAPSATGARIEWDGAGGRTRSGITAGLGADGALLARVDGATERILSGAIRWL